MAGRRRGCRRRGGRGRSLGGRRVPAARSLAPTLLNGFLGLDVYLSFVFASVAQLPHRTLTATFLGFSAARGGSCWTCAPAPGLGAHSPAPGGHPAPGWHPRSRAYRVGSGAGLGARPRTRDPRSRSGLKCASSSAWLRNGGGGSTWASRGSWRPSAQNLVGALLAPSAPRGHVKCWELTAGETRAPGPSHPLRPGVCPLARVWAESWEQAPVNESPSLWRGKGPTYLGG